MDESSLSQCNVAQSQKVYPLTAISLCSAQTNEGSVLGAL